MWVASNPTLEFMGINEFYICFIFIRNVSMLSNVGTLPTSYYTELTVINFDPLLKADF